MVNVEVLLTLGLLLQTAPDSHGELRGKKIEDSRLRRNPRAPAAKRNTSGVFSTPRSPLHDPSTPMRKRPPWRRALGRFLPLIMMAVAVKTRSEVAAIVNVVMAFTYLWLEEVRDKKERE